MVPDMHLHEISDRRKDNVFLIFIKLFMKYMYNIEY